jgi:hypothetical protein
MNNIQKKELEDAWKKLGDIPVIEEGDRDLGIHLVTDESFSFEFSGQTIIFPKGTDQLEIWYWFDDLGFSVGNEMNGLDPWKPRPNNKKWCNGDDYTEEDYLYEQETGRCSICGHYLLECTCDSDLDLWRLD